jgi:hypothetical protein
VTVYGYVVVHATGKVGPRYYSTVGAAKRGCRRDGDSVVAVEIDLNREPLFIRRKVIGAR